MDHDDIIYLVLLLFSIGFGHFYRQIENLKRKQIVGTLVGLGIIFAVSGIHSLHVFILTAVNILIIQLLSIRICHLVSFTFSFLYLIFFRTTIYFGIPYAPAHTNLIIMILTLKLVGLTFEMNTTHTTKSIVGNDVTKSKETAKYDSKEVNPGVIDVIHYAFNYVGVLTGPYYTYRTYWDSLHYKFAKFASCQNITLQKLMYVPILATLFLSATYIWPFSYALTDEFYSERSWLYRLWYCYPTFFIFRMRIYLGIILSECVCTLAGLGAYPICAEPKPGAGPSRNFILLKEINDDEAKLAKEDYNFETIRNIQIIETESCNTFREAIKHWNTCVQYWLAVNIYQRFPSKKFRTLVTMFISAVWHGVYIGHYFTICGAPFYLLVEDVYVKLLLKKNNSKYVKLWEWILWIVKMWAFSYLSVAFHLLTVGKVLHYYNSIYHIGFILGGLLYVIGIYLLKYRKTEKPLDNVPIKTE